MRVLLLLGSLVSSSLAVNVNLERVLGEGVGEKIMIKYEVENNGDEAVTLLKHNTPFEVFRDTLVGNPFEIVHQETSQIPVYLGVMMKHSEPTAEDYIVIPAGQTYYTNVDLTSAYQMNGKGTYIVRPVDTGFGIEAARTVAITLESGDDFLAQQDLSAYEAVPENVTGLLSVSSSCGVPNILTNCYSSDETAIRNSWTQASQCLPALPVYGSASPGDPNTIRWMGGGGTGLSSVQAGLQRCQQLLCRQGSFGNGARASCDYGCSAYGYVYPADSTFTIYLCRSYFRAPAAGKDSKFGTVIHEAVHFNAIHGAQDYQYGCAGCQSLAGSNPNTARQNSDSIEYLNEFSGFFTPIPSC